MIGKSQPCCRAECGCSLGDVALIVVEGARPTGAPSWEGSGVMNRPDVAAVFHFWEETSIAGFRAAR